MAESCEPSGPPEQVWDLTCEPAQEHQPEWVPARTQTDVMVRNIGALMPNPILHPPQNGPCVPWVTCEEVRACCPGAEDVPDDQLMVAIMYASEYLYYKSGRRYTGICERVVRPPCSPCCEMFLGSGSHLGRIGGLFSGGLWSSNYGYGFTSWGVGLGSCLCGSNCSGCNGCDLTNKTLRLPGPISGIKYIAINGEILDPSAYKIADYRELIRMDGKCWPQCNDITRDPTIAPPPVKPHLPAPKPKRLLPDKPDWVNDYLEGINWFWEATPVVDCKYCAIDHDPADIPSWAKEFMSTLVCDEKKNRLAHTPCAECAPWVNDYLRENNITILKGKCTTCCDSHGNTMNGCGVTYICDPCAPSSFKACCKERANRCCDPSYDGPSEWEANCCLKKGCHCSSHKVAPKTKTFTCVDSCPTAPPIQCVSDWARRYMEANNIEVPAPVPQNWHSRGGCSHHQTTPHGVQCLAPWIQAYITDNNLTNSIVFGKCATCRDQDGNAENPLTGAIYICDCIPGMNCRTEERERVVVRPCCRVRPNACCDPNYNGEPLTGNDCCQNGCDCEPFVIVEEVVICDDCESGAPKWTGPVPPCGDGSPAPCREWPNWLREYFGFAPLITEIPKADESLSDWVNEYLNDFHKVNPEPKCGEKVPVDLKVCDSPWAKNFLRGTTDKCGNPYDIPADPPPAPDFIPYYFVPNFKTDECYVDADHLGDHVRHYGCGSDMDAWEIAYYQGREVPWGGKLAAAELACEIARARCGDGKCRLPRNVAYLTRQDVSMSFTPMHKLITAGLTGLFEVDMWINSVNPCGIHRRASLHSPDNIRRRNRQLR